MARIYVPETVSSETPPDCDLPIETSLTSDNPLVDLSRVPNDADDTSDAGLPTTDHEEIGWRATPAVKP